MEPFTLDIVNLEFDIRRNKVGHIGTQVVSDDLDEEKYEQASNANWAGKLGVTLTMALGSSSPIVIAPISPYV